jgi:hypothetical protein
MGVRRRTVEPLTETTVALLSPWSKAFNVGDTPPSRHVSSSVLVCALFAFTYHNTQATPPHSQRGERIWGCLYV